MEHMDRQKNAELMKAEFEKARANADRDLNDCVIRGHLRSLSADAEDQIGLFVWRMIPECKIYLDTSVKVNGKTHRPDLLLVHNDKVIAMMEIKANMGYCRNASDVIDRIRNDDREFSEFIRNNNDKLTLSISEHSKKAQKIDVLYTENVKLFLISFSSRNCSEEKHATNKCLCAGDDRNKRTISYYCLYDGEYDQLEERDINSFMNELEDIRNSIEIE